MKSLVFLGFIFLLLNLQIAAQETDQKSTSGGEKITYVKMVVRSAPKFTLQFSGSYNHGIYELSGNDNGDFNPQQYMIGENFGVRHGLGANITAKIPLHEKGNIRLNISAMYNNFNSKIIENKEGGFANYNVYTGGIGLENNFTPSYKFKTLVGASIIASVISGNAQIITGTINKNLNVKPAFRLGISLYSGFEYLINDAFGLNMGYQFNQANLWLKDTKAAPDENTIYLNDKRVTPRIPYSGWRQFAWGAFYGGVNLYFGISKKDYILKNFGK